MTMDAKIKMSSLTPGGQYIFQELDKKINPKKYRKNLNKRKRTVIGRNMPQSMVSLKNDKTQRNQSQKTLANAGKSILMGYPEARETNFYNYAMNKKIDSKQFQNTFIRLKKSTPFEI